MVIKATWNLVEGKQRAQIAEMPSVSYMVGNLWCSLYRRSNEHVNKAKPGDEMMKSLDLAAKKPNIQTKKIE